MASYTPRTRPSMRNLSSSTFASTTPTMTRAVSGGSSDLQVGDTVNVPGGMDGLVKFVGEVKGKQGYFVGVELSRKWAARGKNDGDVDGTKYFTTSNPGAGIFLPISRAIKRSSPTTSASNPTSPTDLTPTPAPHTLSTRTPPTPSFAPKFSQSVGPGRAPSPAFRPRSRPSLPRPESPLRRTQNASNNTSTPMGGSRPSLNMLSHNRLGPGPGPRFAPSPTPGKPAPRTPKLTSTFTPLPSVKAGPRSASALRNSRDGDGDEVARLHALLAEKNEKIAILTAEFDTHRSDFRSTLDTLELASTETERVYERRVEELLAERHELMSERQELLNERQDFLSEREGFLAERGELVAQSEDVESVAFQLRQLEEVVAELEEGLEDARRGEAEARGEVEFLRGEVERVRAELRREREGKVGAVNGRRESGGLVSANKEVKETETGVGIGAGIADADKWCALCEGDGHDSISCPFDKA